MKIKIERIKMGMTQKQLGEALGVSSATIHRLERGDYDQVTLKLMKKIAAFFNSSIEFLFLED